MVLVKKLPHYDSSFALPKYETSASAGADLRACFENKQGIWIAPWERCLIPTRLTFEFCPTLEGQIRPRSGISLKTTLMIPNSPGTIDADYRGEVKIIMANMGPEKIFITHGDRIAQIVFSKIEKVDFKSVEKLSSSQREKGGFGSTGLSN